ncbi:LytR family transcriptional attenuator [Halanaerobium saccharolyticum]|uniref:LytR family transcriptional attenuator n=1 Tax=Halanaerobium saccharolyticum TaxID=43595 RepID=A0A4R7YU31_9FIRM|nr:LCP family protein [Halanaerobium saccharolyticum]RAK06677.1 LytR family transcriptional attenuator [Halanaerobium saccharolyticum]TDW01314.1 LytR family transcriptional attenuator [Halanaerobium saccharolyticum]TDX52782.1 LytR family transcriptional attenuator [Halanaerobium saccharolyticum]
MAEKNTQDNQKSKKKHKWIGVFLIALLLLFIGLAGYYLERDLEPVPDNQVEENEVMEPSKDSIDEEPAMNGEEGETQVTEETAPTEESTDSAKKIETGTETEKVTESEDTAATSDRETEKDEGDTEKPAEQTEESDAPPAEDEDIVETETAIESESDTADEITDTGKTSAVESEEAVRDTAAEDGSVETEEKTANGDQSQKATPETEDSIRSDIEPESEDAVEEDEAEITAESEPEEDTAQDREDQVERDEQLEGDAGVERDEQLEDETQDDFARELEDPSLLDRILSILGLSESDFTQDLNILFVGLDSEESVAIGTVEADSIMLAKLRPELNQLQIEHIDEDTIYQGQLLRKYHNGDISTAVEDIAETEIDYYVYLKYQGFEKVIDELGGVQISLEEEIVVPGLGLNLKEGDNLLSGKEALNFVRWRSSDSMDRFERQKLLINSVISKLKSNNILFNVKELYNTIVESYNSIETDINPVLAAEIFNYVRENDELKLEFIE